MRFAWRWRAAPGAAREQLCAIVYEANANRAVLIISQCLSVTDRAAANGVTTSCGRPSTRAYYLVGNQWAMNAGEAVPPLPEAEAQARDAAIAAALRQGQVEVRDVQRRQVFIGGHPVGDAFD